MMFPRQKLVIPADMLALEEQELHLACAVALPTSMLSSLPVSPKRAG